MPNGQLRDKVSGADDLHHAARASLSCSKQVLVLVLVPLCVSRKVSAGVDQAALGRDGIPQSPHFNTSLTPNLTSTKTLYLLPHVVILVNLPCRVTGARQQQQEGQRQVGRQ